MVTGQYVAPKAGRITFREYAEAWRAVQVFRDSTAALNTYAHLWPDSDDRTREAVDVALANPADSLRTTAD